MLLRTPVVGAATEVGRRTSEVGIMGAVCLPARGPGVGWSKGGHKVSFFYCRFGLTNCRSEAVIPYPLLFPLLFPSLFTSTSHPHSLLLTPYSSLSTLTFIFFPHILMVYTNMIYFAGIRSLCITYLTGR